MRGKADALTDACGCVTDGVIFLKSAGTVRSRFCKNRSKGYGDVAPSSEKWLQAALLATLVANPVHKKNFYTVLLDRGSEGCFPYNTNIIENYACFGYFNTLLKYAATGRVSV